MALTVLCMILTFAGGGYVLYTHGEASAGAAVVPAVFTLIFLRAYRYNKSRKKK